MRNSSVLCIELRPNPWQKREATHRLSEVVLRRILRGNGKIGGHLRKTRIAKSQQASRRNYFPIKGAVWPHLPVITNSRIGLRTRGAVSRSRSGCGREAGSPGY